MPRLLLVSNRLPVHLSASASVNAEGALGARLKRRGGAMIKGSLGGWAIVLSTTAAGCGTVLGIDEDYYLIDEAVDAVGAVGAVGTLGEPCPNVGMLACGGNAQKSKLICGADGKWATNGTCDGDTLCDTSIGVDQGVCKPAIAECAGKSSTDIFCEGTKRVKCSSDQVTTEEVETCPHGCSGGQCVLPNCAGLTPSCGPKGDESCCMSSVVPGGTFNRSNDAMFPATVSEFRLDRFEITVGRFRVFVAAYPGSKPKAGAGAHPLIAGSGWDARWDSNLPTDQAALMSALKDCLGQKQTWTDTPAANENLPMNCISWYETFAFCAWDGGRLPTEAEWNYAAAGGGEQRQYPWGSTAPDAEHTVYNCTTDGSSGCAFTDIVKVGSKPSGDGKWGQADLAGSMWEWNLDGYGSYIFNCTNCANLKTSDRVTRGGAWFDDASLQLSSFRDPSDPADRYNGIGARCARNP